MCLMPPPKSENSWPICFLPVASPHLGKNTWASSANRSRMLPPVDVTPLLSNALRYSSATDLRCSSVIVCRVSAMCPRERRTGYTTTECWALRFWLEDPCDRVLGERVIAVARSREDLVRHRHPLRRRGQVAIQRHNQLPPADADHVVLHRRIGLRVVIRNRQPVPDV